MLTLELARCEYVLRHENIIAIGNSGTGKTHTALALGLAACQHGKTHRCPEAEFLGCRPASKSRFGNYIAAPEGLAAGQNMSRQADARIVAHRLGSLAECLKTLGRVKMPDLGGN